MIEITDEMLDAAHDAWSNRKLGESTFPAIIAAVAPLIAAQVREECAGVADDFAEVYATEDQVDMLHAAEDIADRIRALINKEPDRD